MLKKNITIYTLMKKISLALSLLFSSIIGISAQSLTPSEDIVDCGQIQFCQPKTVSVELTNNSSKQVTIKSIRNACGCTKTKISKKNIGSRKSATLEIEYDAQQLGHFYRHIEVYTKQDEKPLLIQIRGVVVTEVKDFSKAYPFVIGGIRTDKNEVEFDDVYKGDKPQQTIHIVNTTGTTIEPVVMHLPDYISAEVEPQRIMPEEGGEIRLTLLSEKIHNFGLSQTSLYLGKKMGEKVSPEKEIPTSVILLPSPERGGGLNPEIVLSSKVLETKNMSGKPNKKRGEIIIQNTGKGNLNISSLQMSTTGLQVSLGKQQLRPMESTTLKITADEEEIHSQKTRSRILMITNDPKSPKVVIEIK